MREFPPPPFGTLKQWGERLNSFLISTKDLLTFKTDDATAYRNGVMLWDDTNNYPVVSIDGVWTPLGIGGGTNQGSHGFFYDTTTQTATASDTAYAVTFNNSGLTNNISINSGDSSRIDFAKAGKYLITFTATMESTSASTKTVYFFPKVNGVDVANSGIISTVHENGQRKVVTRNGIFSFSAGDYLQAMWAVDDTDLYIEPESATAFAPATPSVTMTINEITTS
jgi:hypothetical protein